MVTIDTANNVGAFIGYDSGNNIIKNSFSKSVFNNVGGSIGLLVGISNANLMVENVFGISEINLSLYGNRSTIENAVNVYSTFTTNLASIIGVINNSSTPLWDNNIWSFDSEYPSLIALA
jgi:hypothetical protein